MMTDKAELFAQAWKLLAPHMSAPKREYRFHTVRKWRFDFAFVDSGVAVEVDGGQFAFRGGRHATDADRDKLNTAAAMGWRVFRFSPKQLRVAPIECVELVIIALGRKDSTP